MFFGSISNTALEKAASGLWQRQRAIMHNIANEDTPGYHAKRVDFETYLKNEMDSVRRGGADIRQSVDRLEKSRIREYELEDLNGRMDENNVDIDSEYVELARVQIQYGAITQRISGYYSNLKYIIRGGR